MLEGLSYKRTWHYCAITATNIPFVFFWRSQSSSPTHTPIWLCLDQIVHTYVQIMRKQVSEILPSLVLRLPMSSALIPITLVQKLEGSSKTACPANLRVILSITGRTRQISDGLCVSDCLHTSRLGSIADRLTDNVRYTLSTCIYGRPNRIASTNPNLCQHECSALQDSIVSNLSTPQYIRTFAYCSNQFLLHLDECASCYGVVKNRLYLSNCMFSTSGRYCTKLTS